MVGFGNGRLDIGYIFLLLQSQRVAVERNKIENAGRAQRGDRALFSALHQPAFDSGARLTVFAGTIS